MKATFDTDSVREYEFTHGHKPRGDGGWIFDVVWSDGAGSYMNERVTVTGSYAKAKAEAMSVARRNAPGAAREAVVFVCT